MGLTSSLTNAIHLLANIAFELILIRAACKMLHIRSVFAYGGLTLATLGVSYISMRMGAPNTIRALLTSLTSNIILPLAFSTGSVRSRLIRIGALNISMVVSELLASTVYGLVSGEASISSIELVRPEHALVIYAVITPTLAATLEVLVTVFSMFDNEENARFEPPIIILMFASIVLYSFVYMRSMHVEHPSILVNVTILASSLLTLVICFLTLYVARKDMHAQRELTDRIATERQMRHVFVEVDGSLRRARSAQHLRHDIANQIDVIEELGKAGQVEEADRYLAELLQRASALAGDAHE